MTPSSAHAFASYPSLRDASVIVTGGASGIGMEIVRAFAGQDSRVGLLDFDVEHGDRLAADLQASEGQVRFEPCDLRDSTRAGARPRPSRTRTARHACWSTTPRVTTVTGGEDVTPEFYDERIATNLRHMFFFAIQAVAPGMIAAGGGSIINLGSDSWWRAGGGFPVYTTAKAAVHGLRPANCRKCCPTYRSRPSARKSGACLFDACTWIEPVLPSYGDTESPALC